MEKRFPTIASYVAAWDRNDVVPSIEMGGLGPGYEQCIQILFVEILRDECVKPIPTEFPDDWGDETVDRLEPKLGFSGAQVGATKSLAAYALVHGIDAMLDKTPDRRIWIQKVFPNYE